MNNSTTAPRHSTSSGRGSYARTLGVGLALVAVLVVSSAMLLDDPVGAVRERVGGPSSGVGVDDGFIGEDTVTVDDVDLPAIARLRPEIRAALRTATTDAGAVGIQVLVTSGWRSSALQQQLLDEGVEKYGSLAEASRWVASPTGSSHVTGNAVDVGATDAAYWMQQNGFAYGLCQVYTNEIWHYELLVEPGGLCPVPRLNAAAG